MTHRPALNLLLVSLAVAGGMLTACNDTSPAGSAAGPAVPVASTSNPAPAVTSDPAVTPCGEITYTIDTVRDLQRGIVPPDERDAARRIVAFAKSAPTGLTAAAEGVTGPTIIAFKHPQARGEVDTEDVNADLTTLEQWRSQHC